MVPTDKAHTTTSPIPKPAPTPAARSTPVLSYWRDGELGGACLARARYGAHRFERHVHDEMVLAITEDGAGEVRTRQGTEVGCAGTVWVFAPGEYHGGRVVEGRHWFYRGVYLDAPALKELAAVFGEDSQTRLFVPPGLYHDQQLARLLLAAHGALERPGPILERQVAWWSAMGLLFGRYGRPRPRQDSASAERSRMVRVRDFLVANYRRNISIQELASFAGLSRYHFIRCFRREFGMPPHAYLNQLRLIEAKRLLIAGYPPVVAAVESGFYDQSHLARIFKRTYDVPPAAYAALWSDQRAPSSPFRSS